MASTRFTERIYVNWYSTFSDPAITICLYMFGWLITTLFLCNIERQYFLSFFVRNNNEDPPVKQVNEI